LATAGDLLEARRPALAATAVEAAAAGIANPVSADSEGVNPRERDRHEETDEGEGRYTHEQTNEKEN
jgi:hypothetical protein